MENPERGQDHFSSCLETGVSMAYNLMKHKPISDIRDVVDFKDAFIVNAKLAVAGKEAV